MKSDVARVVFIVFAVLYQPCPQVYADFVANSASDSTLASKFAPVLVLTKNPTRPGREVLRPEPVEIMGAESLWNVYFSVWTADGNSLSQNGRTPVQWRELENLLGSQGFANVNFADNKFAYLGMDSPTELDGEWVSPHFFDYPGEDKESWNREYESGLKAGKNGYIRVFQRAFYSVYRGRFRGFHTVRNRGRNLRRDIEVSDTQINQVGKGIQRFKSTGAVLEHAHDGLRPSAAALVRCGTDEGGEPAACFRTVPTNRRKGSRRLRRAAVVHFLRKRSAAQRAL